MLVLIIVLISFLIIAFIASRVIYKRVFYTPVKGQNDLERVYKGEQSMKYASLSTSLTLALSAKECQMVYIHSLDGLKLEGRYYSLSPDSSVVICVHGYRGTAVRDFCGRVDLYLSLGLNVLLISQRGCMLSEGESVTFGVKERDDVREWIKWVEERYGSSKSIYLAGISMGAHTVLSLSSSLEGVNIRGIIADCPYTSARAIMEKELRAAGIPPFLLMWLISFTTRFWAHFSINVPGAVEGVEKTSIPILLLHGDKDGLVPYSMSQEIEKANPKMVRLVTFSSADHAMSYFVDTPLYEREVKAFIEKTR